MTDPLEMDLHEGPLERRIKELERRMETAEQYFSATEKTIYERLLALEEKDRERAKDEHAREEHLDFLDSEGLGKQ